MVENIESKKININILMIPKNNVMNNLSKIVLAAAAGAAAGAIIAILFAPDKGSKTRKKISEEGKKIADNLKDQLQKSKEKFNDLKEDITEFIKEKRDEFA